MPPIDDDEACECCDSPEQHRAREAESLREFLLDPGPPPAHWDEETRQRVARALERARATNPYPISVTPEPVELPSDVTPEERARRERVYVVRVPR